jgi:hypothetical protein
VRRGRHAGGPRVAVVGRRQVRDAVTLARRFGRRRGLDRLDLLLLLPLAAVVGQLGKLAADRPGANFINQLKTEFTDKTKFVSLWF